MKKQSVGGEREQSALPRTEVSSVKAYGIQLYGFLVKTFHQRRRSPISTLSTIFIPLIFMLLLGVCYWTTSVQVTPSLWYGSNPVTDEANVTMNYTTIVKNFFCKHPAATLPLSWSTCAMPPSMLDCLDFVGSGEELCVPTPMVSALSGFLNSLYYYSGGFTLNSMDGHLSISAFTKKEREKGHPTYFGRNGRESITHYGELVVASESAELASAFQDFCRTRSGMCSAVLHDEVFETLGEAEAYALSHSDEVWAVVHLPSDLLTSEEETVPFTISMNYSATPWTFKDKMQNLFSRPSAGSEPYLLYLTSGFLTLQQFIQQFVLETHVKKDGASLTGPATYASTSTSQGMDIYLSEWSGTVLPMPTAATAGNGFLVQWGYYVPLVCALAALFPVAALTAVMVEEKASGIREAMLIMGMHPTCMFSGWYLTSLPLDVVAALLVAMVMKVGFLSNASYSLLFVLYFTFQQQNTAFSMLMSTLFSNPRIASWCAALSVFVFAMPYYTFPPGMRDSGKWGASTVPVVGFSVGIGEVINYVSFEVNVDWSVARRGEFSVVDAIGMMWVSFAAMLILALYLDRVWPAAVGRRESPFFFLRYLFGCCCCCKKASDPAPIALYKRDEEDDAAAGEEDALPAARPAEMELIEHYDEVVDPLDEDVPVIFKDVSMVYVTGGILGFLYTLFTGFFRDGDYRLGLHRVSFALHRGEVNTLIGPNGAGKTTIMNLATGMRTAHSGTVYIAGHNAADDFSSCRRHIGYCPQRNIIWDELTVAEHLAFYARLKGAASINVDETVEETMELTGLTEKRDSKAGGLSGGQKRRLCVGMAMVGRSEVLFMDELTAGLDVKGRREVYEVLHRARAGRSILLSTHLMDEADKLGDRLLILGNGELCAEGSVLFLKSKTNVGYKLTCVMDSTLTAEEEMAAVAGLLDFVREKGSGEEHMHRVESEDVQAIPPGCRLLGLETRGREVTFMFPLSFLSGAGRGLLRELQDNQKALRVQSLAMTLTTLEDVFRATTMRQLGLGTGAPMHEDGPSGAGRCPFAVPVGDMAEGDAPTGSPLMAQKLGMSPTMLDTESVASPAPARGMADLNDDEFYYTSNTWRFFSDFRALFAKRLHYAKRDGQLVLFQVVLPMLFLTVALLINLAQSPEQPALTLDMQMYSGYKSNPSEVLITRAGEIHAAPDTFHVTTSTEASTLGAYYDPLHVLEPTSMGTISGIEQMNVELYRSFYTHEQPRYISIATSNMVLQSGMPMKSTVVFHNATYAHAAPQAINALYSLALSQMYGSEHVAKPVAINRPMHLGSYEKKLVDTNKQVIMGMFIILAFILIPCNTISYIVQEKASGARHMQWLTGSSMLAYWLSAFVFDMLCFIGTIVLAFIIFVVFDREEYIGKEMIGPSICLFLFFGISSTLSSYVVSFFFSSPFKAQSTVLVLNFVFGFLWVTCESMLAASAFHFVVWACYFLRVLPCVSFGEGLYVLAGTGMGWMMYPGTAHESLFGLLKMTESGRSVFQGGVGTALIYMGCVVVASVVALVVLEYFRVQQCGVFSRLYHCCCARRGGRDPEGVDAVVSDATVRAEEARVCENETGPKEDCIVMQHVAKSYVGARRPALEDLSVGVHRGEVLALLGLNGAGKSTAVSILSGERAASAGSVYINHHSLASEDSRHYIGYCPQFDALLDKLTPLEHLVLFARLRRMREECIAEHVDRLIREIGLYPHRHQAAGALSGGNKRRLSLALALIGNTTSVLLDEPTSGMDAFARAQTCAALKYLTQAKSVILITHLFDETDALADRVAVVAAGRMVTIGRAQELQSNFSAERDGLTILRVHHAGGEVTEAELARLQDFIAETIVRQGGGASPRVQALEVLGSGVKFGVRGCERMEVYCDVVSALTSHEVDGLPEISYVSVSQPSMEDILLATA